MSRALLEQLALAGMTAEERIEAARPKTDRTARVMHLREVLDRVRYNVWTVGDLVTVARDAGLNQGFIGEPCIVLRVRKPGEQRCSHDDELVQIATIDVDGDVQTAWVAEWRLEKYVE